MIHLAICDDDKQTLDSVGQLVTKYADMNPQLGLIVNKFNSVYDLVESIEKGERSYQIYVLDIIMPLINGIDVGKYIRKYDEQALIIFMTSSTDYVMDALSVSLFQYLLKPIESQKLYPVLERACSKITQTMDTNVMLRVKGGIAYVRYHQIMYIEYINHAMTFHLATGKSFITMVMRESFSNYIDMHLQDPRFIKPHASFVVNMDFVQLITTKEFEMINGEKIPISKRAYTNVRRKFINYMVSRHDSVAN